jgi:hypothetical protein
MRCTHGGIMSIAGFHEADINRVVKPALVAFACRGLLWLSSVTSHDIINQRSLQAVHFTTSKNVSQQFSLTERANNHVPKCYVQLNVYTITPVNSVYLPRNLNEFLPNSADKQHCILTVVNDQLSRLMFLFAKEIKNLYVSLPPSIIVRKLNSFRKYFDCKKYLCLISAMYSNC